MTSFRLASIPPVCFYFQKQSPGGILKNSKKIIFVLESVFGKFAILLKTRIQHRCFPMNSANFLEKLVTTASVICYKESLIWIQVVGMIEFYLLDNTNTELQRKQIRVESNNKFHDLDHDTLFVSSQIYFYYTGYIVVLRQNLFWNPVDQRFTLLHRLYCSF